MKMKIVKASTTKFLKVKPSCRKNIVIPLVELLALGELFVEQRSFA
jgi:hypothetical protein